ncbi:MAG: SPFH domain-containing protein [Flavobacteriales bacterium]|nr:SPFH domain-containing protein [Flavobacteriales bacterium]
MNFILGLIAAILFAIAVAVFLLPDSVKQKIPVLKGITTSRAVLLIFAGIIVAGLNGLTFYAKPGTAYAVQYLWGGDQAITSQGIKFKYWGRLIPMSFEIPIQDILNEESPREEGIYYQRAKQREFSDAIKADIATSLVIGINYKDEAKFLDMADKNRSEERLVYGRIIPVYEQALKNTCKLMSAQEYISGASAQFDYYLRDQLENGMYLTEEDIDSAKVDVIGDSTVKRTVVSGAASLEKQRAYRIRKNAAGDPMRDTSNSLKKYGLTVIQAAVTNIDWEPSFDTRLQLQKEQVAQTQLEKQEAEKEYYATQKAIQKGEREKAEERARLEKMQIKETIAAETKAKAAVYIVEEEKLNLEAEQLRAARKKVAADASYYENSKLVAAGLSPQDRAQIDKEVAIGVAQAISALTLPEVYISGEQKGNNGILTELLGADVARKMLGN